MSHHAHRQRGLTGDPSRRRGVAMVEAVLSMLVISLMVVAAMRTVVASRAGQIEIENRVLASHLAAELMSEILNQHYISPDDDAVFGPEPSEVSAASRGTFDDVDDYHNWTESPPQERDGSPRAHLAGWSRTVEVAWVMPHDVTATSLTDLGVKRITVTVHRNGMRVSRVTALRTAAVR